MSVDCSMILRDDRLRNMNAPDERLARLQEIQDYLVKKYGIANSDEAIPWTDNDGGVFPRFNFEPYGIVSINMYNGFWEIETAWRYSQYFDENGGPSGLKSDFFDIARDFECDDAYICSEFCAWNGGNLEMRNFDEWLDDMRSRFGDIRELKTDTKYSYDSKFPEVFHESFTACKERMAEVFKEVEAKGYKANGISCIGWNYITVSKDGKVYLMHDKTFELLIPEPIDYWMDLNRSSFEIVANGKNMLYSCYGQKIFETDKGHFYWEWANHEEWKDFHAIRVYNEESGQEVFVVNETAPTDKPDELYLYHCYYDAKHNLLFPKEQF